MAVCNETDHVRCTAMEGDYVTHLCHCIDVIREYRNYDSSTTRRMSVDRC